MEPNTALVRDRSEWRSWLEKYHNKLDEVWMIFYKVHTGKPCVPYDDAVEEAICFGWIDGKIRRIDDEKYMIRFTPRRARSAWSLLNVRRAERMIVQGKMKEAGWFQINNAKEDGRWQEALDEEERKEKEIIIPDDLAKAFARNRKAWENFKQMAPGYRRDYIRWIKMAKREETRKRRIKEVVNRAKQNIKAGM